MAKRVNLSKLAAEAQRAAEDWLAEQSVDDRVIAALNTRVSEIAAKLLGFNCSWNRWEVDHCNGRGGESAVGDYLREKCGDGVKKWLDDLSGNLPPLPRDARSSLVKSYHSYLEQEILNLLKKRARDDAVAIVEEIVSSVELVDKQEAVS